MKNYYRVMLGRKSIYLQDCLQGNFIGVDFKIHQDLVDQLPEEWREFNRKFIPIYLENHPDKSKVAAGLAMGAVHTVCKGMQLGDIVFSPDGVGNYHVCEIDGPYYYVPGGILPHRRPVKWIKKISREEISENLLSSLSARGTYSSINNHDMEIERLLGNVTLPRLQTSEGVIEDLTAFAMEKHLEDFMVKNWSITELGRDYDIFKEEGECVGQQFPTDTGPIDILAVSKDKHTLLVIELKKGRASDSVVGQILRYMGYVRDELADPGQSIKGVIIAMEDDQRLKRALAMVPDIEFYRYEVTFKLKRD